MSKPAPLGKIPAKFIKWHVNYLKQEAELSTYIYLYYSLLFSGWTNHLWLVPCHSPAVFELLEFFKHQTTFLMQPQRESVLQNRKKNIERNTSWKTWTPNSSPKQSQNISIACCSLAASDVQYWFLFRSDGK